MPIDDIKNEPIKNPPAHSHEHKNENNLEIRHSHEGNHGHRHEHEHTKKVLNRMARAIGHMNAIKTMIEKDRDCSEILIQLAAVRAAINGISEVIIKDHLDHCVINAIKDGDTAAIDELNRAIKMLLK